MPHTPSIDANKGFTMRIAMLSDLHGYITSLDAVLKDIEQQGGVDEYWTMPFESFVIIQEPIHSI